MHARLAAHSHVSASRPPDAWGQCWGLAASSALHVAVIAALSFVWISATPPRVAPTVTSDWTTNPPSELDATVNFDSALSTENSAADGGRTALTVPLTSSDNRELTVAWDARSPQSSGPVMPDVDLREGVPALTSQAGRGEGAGLGSGRGDGAGLASGPAFFPMEKPTGRYVFVVDCSKSMNHRYPGPAKTRLGRVKVELWKTIYQMSPEQKFFIVFFNTAAHPMPATQMTSGGPPSPGAPSVHPELFQWTVGIRAEGLTDPQDALLMAVRMQPDVIYFLTDGEFNYRVVRDVTRANFAGVTIHTISLGDNSGARFLEEIALANGGAYRHIDQDADRYWTDDAATEAAPSR